VTETLSPEELASMPIFPLPKLVLFPGALLPLHFFEPRYRALMHDCLAQGPRCMAVAQVRPGFEPAFRPPIFDRAGVGRILEHTLNADGTYDVLLEGIARVFLDEQPDQGPYRRATAHVLNDRLPAGGIEHTEVTAVMALAESVRHLVRQSRPDFELTVQAADPAERIVDKLADQLVADPAIRQDLLETLDVQQRFQIVARQVATLESLLKARLRKSTSLN
jgi:Lon protease-like protein